MSENSSKNRSLPLVPTRSVTVRATAPYFRPCFPVQWNLKLSVNSVRAWLKVVTHCHFHHVHNLHSVVPLQHAVCQLSVYMHSYSLTTHSLLQIEPNIWHHCGLLLKAGTGHPVPLTKMWDAHTITHSLTHSLTHSQEVSFLTLHSHTHQVMTVVSLTHSLTHSHTHSHHSHTHTHMWPLLVYRLWVPLVDHLQNTWSLVDRRCQGLLVECTGETCSERRWVSEWVSVCVSVWVSECVCECVSEWVSEWVVSEWVRHIYTQLAHCMLQWHNWM